MRQSALLAILVSVLLLAGIAHADPENRNHLLRGEYAFSGAASCLVTTPAGFNADLVPQGASFATSFAVVGVRTFDGNGGGTVQGRTISIVEPGRVGAPPGFPAIPSVAIAGNELEFSVDFTYTVSPDGRTVSLEHFDFNGQFTAGPNTGETLILTPLAGDPLLPQIGRIGHDQKTLVVATATPTVEVATRSDGLVQHRLCHRSRTAIKIR